MKNILKEKRKNLMRIESIESAKRTLFLQRSDEQFLLDPEDEEAMMNDYIVNGEFTDDEEYLREEDNYQKSGNSSYLAYLRTDHWKNLKKQVK